MNDDVTLRNAVMAELALGSSARSPSASARAT